MDKENKIVIIVTVAILAVALVALNFDKIIGEGKENIHCVNSITCELLGDYEFNISVKENQCFLMFEEELERLEKEGCEIKIEKYFMESKYADLITDVDIMLEKLKGR